MNKLLHLFRALFAYAVIGLAIAIVIVPCFVIACLPASVRYDNRVYYWLNNVLYKATLFGIGLSITVEGGQNLPHEPAIIIANHQSALDIPLLGSILNGAPHVWLFYVRYTKIPLIGFLLRRMNVVIDPSGLRKLVGSLEKTAEIVKKRQSHVMIFPEGGRFNDGIMHKFFYGFAVLASKTERPVVPVLLYNAGRAYPPHSFFIYSHPVRVVIGKPFCMQEGESQDAFVQRVHAWFLGRV